MLTFSSKGGLAAAILTYLMLATTPCAASNNWPLFDNTPSRVGSSATDKSISRANIGKLHRRWTIDLDSPADSAPILISNVRLSPKLTVPLLVETTRDGSTYAINARTGSVVWRHTTRGPNITTSMPAADPSLQFVYAPGVDGFVHKLSLFTGTEIATDGFPIRITWAPDVEKDAAALNVANGYLYAATSGYLGDYGAYVGHVVSVRLRDGDVHVFNSLCADIHNLLGNGDSCAQSKSGIWSRGGVVVDPDPAMHGRVYVATGNGKFDANSGGHDYGDSILALGFDGVKLADYYTPTNFDDLEAGDTDLGSTAPVMLPRQKSSHTPLMAVQGGKDGILRLLNRKHLGGVGGEIRDYTLGPAIFSAPAVWQDGDVTTIVVGTSGAVTALRLKTDSNGRSRLVQQWVASVSGTSPIVVNGIVFVASDSEVDALDARTGFVIWSSARASAGGTIAGIHWQSPTVADGWLYISDQAARLTAYSL